MIFSNAFAVRQIRFRPRKNTAEFPPHPCLPAGRASFVGGFPKMCSDFVQGTEPDWMIRVHRLGASPLGGQIGERYGAELRRKDLTPFCERGYWRSSSNNSFCFFSIWNLVSASTTSRRTGSVFETRRLNHQSGYSTVIPSSSFNLPSWYLFFNILKISLVASGESLVAMLISPEWAYFINGLIIFDSGCWERLRITIM